MLQSNSPDSSRTIVRSVSTGRLIRVKQGPTFNGRHNQVKSMAFIVLLQNQNAGGQGLTVNEIAEAIGSNTNSVHVLVNRWLKWGYVGHNGVEWGRRYHITAIASHWLEKWDKRGVLPIKKYLSMIIEIRKQQDRELEEFKARIAERREYYKKNGRWPD